MEHNPSFTLFFICSLFFTQSELPCSYKVCSYKKRVYAMNTIKKQNYKETKGFLTSIV